MADRPLRGALGLLLVLVALTLAVAHGVADQVDRPVRSALSGRLPEQESLLRAVLRLGDLEVHVGVVAAAAGLALVLGRSPLRVAWVLLVAATGAAATYGLKRLLDRPASYVIDGQPGPMTGAYPSGHTVCTVLVVGVTVLLLGGSGRRVATAALVLGGIAGAGQATALLLLQQHWASDVVGGWLVGALLLVVAGTPHPSSPRDPDRGAAVLVKESP